MSEAPRQLPAASNASCSISAIPTPSVRPPWTWPSTIIGLICNSAIIDGDEPAHPHLPRPRIDVDHDVGTERKRQVRRVVDGLGVEPGLHPGRQRHGTPGGQRDLRDRRALLRIAAHDPPPGGAAIGRPLQILRRYLEHGRGDEAGPVADLARHHRGRGAADRRRTRAVGAQPVRSRVGVAVDHLDVRRRDAELVRDDLGERRLVPLTLGLDADRQLGGAGRRDPQCGAVVHPQPGDVHVLPGSGADRLGEERDPHPHQLPAARAWPARGAARRSRRDPARSAAPADSHRSHRPSRWRTHTGTARTVTRLSIRNRAGSMPDLGRQQVDQPLDQVHRLGDPERAGVGDPTGRLVRIDAADVAVRSLQVV